MKRAEFVVEDGSFIPDEEITRAKMAAMLTRAMDHSSETSSVTSFQDEKDILVWAKADIAYLIRAGMLQGRGNNQLVRKDHATRAEVLRFC